MRPEIIRAEMGRETSECDIGLYRPTAGRQSSWENWGRRGVARGGQVAPVKV